MRTFHTNQSFVRRAFLVHKSVSKIRNKTSFPLVSDFIGRHGFQSAPNEKKSVFVGVSDGLNIVYVHCGIIAYVICRRFVC